MTMRLDPYLTFNGDAREAMELYQRVLGGDLRINTFGEYGAAEGADAEKVMHAHLETEAGLVIMASDNAPGSPDVAGDRASVCISGGPDDAETLRRYFEGLAEGGQVTMPLEKQMWGDEFGMVTDRFGIPWMIDIGQE